MNLQKEGLWDMTVITGKATAFMKQTQTEITEDQMNDFQSRVIQKIRLALGHT